MGEEGCRQISYILYKVPGTQLPIRDLVLQNDNHKKMERGDGNRLQGESVDQKKRKEKKKRDMKEEINDFHILALL